MPPHPVTLTIVVPAFNEERNLRPVCEGIGRFAHKYFSDYQVVVVDDSSSDGTWEIAQQIAKEDSHVEAFRNPRNRGLGYNYFFGVEKARCQYVMMVPGDNEILADSLEGVFSKVGTADILVTYIANLRVRPIARRLLSRLFTFLINLLFGLRLRYYNGINVIRADLVRKSKPLTNGFAYMAATLVGLIKAGNSYEHVGFLVQKRAYGVTKAFRIRNVASVLKTVASLWKRVYFTRSHHAACGGTQKDENSLPLSRSSGRGTG